MASITRYNGGFLDPFFNDLFGDDAQSEDYGVLNMKSDITAVGDNYEISVELPGMDKKNIGLSLNDGYLTVEAKINRTDEVKGKKGEFLHRERFSGVATREYYVGDVEEKDIKAAYTDGVLTITFPKAAVKKTEPVHSIAIQ